MIEFVCGLVIGVVLTVSAAWLIGEAMYGMER